MRRYSLPLLACALLTLSACKGGDGCDPADPLCNTGGPLPTLSVADVTVTEGSGGTVNAVFTVTLSASASSAVTVSYSTADGTAVAPLDYQSTMGMLTIGSGATSGQITVPIYPDVFDEGADETFMVSLSSPSNATIADGSAVGTITEDDACPLEGTIGSGETVQGELDAGDCFFSGGEFFELWMLVLTSTTDVVIEQVSTDIDSYLVLLEADGTFVNEDDDGSFDLNSRIEATLTPGPYLVVGTSFAADEVGAYDLSINRVFYGATAGQTVASELYTIDQSTGAATLVGPIGFDHVSAIDFHPSTGVLYGAAERTAADDSTKVLITINPTTGAGTEVGPLGITSRYKITGMSFRDDGTLFAYHAEASAHAIYTINTSTGAATLLGANGLSFNGGNGLAFNNAGTLYHSNGTQTSTINQTNGSATFLSAWTPPAGCNSGRLGAGELLSGGSTIYGIAKCDFTSTGAMFVVVDYPNGTATEIGLTEPAMDALAIR